MGIIPRTEDKSNSNSIELTVTTTALSLHSDMMNCKRFLLGK